MNLINKIRIFLKIKDSINQIEEEAKMANKPIYMSTRFWITVVTNVISVTGALSGMIPATTATIILAAANGLYTILKTLEAQPSITTLVDNSVTNQPK